MAVTPSTPLCVVGYRDANGIRWTHTTMAKTLFEACAHALEWFGGGRGLAIPPTDQTVFDVSVHDQKLFARAGRVREWLREPANGGK